MLTEIFLLTLAACLAVLFWWGFKTLPGERWQVIGCLLGAKQRSGAWTGVNLTYYGFFNATAYLLAAVIFIILMGSLSVPVAGSLTILALVLAVCMPASSLIARWVEGKANTFTVGGAAFAGVIAGPWIILAANRAVGGWMGFEAPVMSVLAAVAVAYAVGEGVGRLACISFGCCYGKPLAACPPLIRKLFRGRAFIFSGETKKIAYAHHLAGQEVVPIQAVTALLLTGVGLLGCYSLLKGFPAATFAALLVVTQGWRALSELLRADYRGTGRITAYQVMALVAIAYAFLLLVLFPTPNAPLPDLGAGLRTLWDPGIIICFELLWLAAFLYTGRSRVTGASIHLHVEQGKI